MAQEPSPCTYCLLFPFSIFFLVMVLSFCGIVLFDSDSFQLMLLCGCNLGFRCEAGDSAGRYGEFDGVALYYSWQGWGAFSLISIIQLLFNSLVRWNVFDAYEIPPSLHFYCFIWLFHLWLLLKVNFFFFYPPTNGGDFSVIVFI